MGSALSVVRLQWGCQEVLLAAWPNILLIFTISSYIYVIKNCGCQKKCSSWFPRKVESSVKGFSIFFQTIPMWKITVGMIQHAEVCQRRWSPLVGSALTSTARSLGESGIVWAFFGSRPYMFTHVGVSENSVSLNPMVLLIIIPIKWL